MSVAVTLNLDETVLDLLKKEAERRGTTLDQTFSDIIRNTAPPRPHGFEVNPISSGLFPNLDYTNPSELAEQFDSPCHR